MTVCNNTTLHDDLYAHTVYGLAGLSFLGLPGNMLVIILISRARKMRFHSTTYLLFNLAVADLINILFIDTAAILVFIGEDHRKEKMPILMFTVIPVVVANFTLAMISLERYNALVKTMKSFMTITKRKVVVGILCSWLISSALIIPIVAHIKMEHPPRCEGHHELGVHYYIRWLVPLAYFPPLVVVIFCYASILKGVYIDGSVLGKTMSEESLNEKKRLVRILFVVTLLFLACNVPAITLKLYMFYVESFNTYKRLYLVTVFLGCLSSCLNPFVYALKSENYRSQVKSLFGRNHGNDNGTNPPVFDTRL